MITVIILAGGVIKIVYNAYGMASLPIFLIKGTMSLEDERLEVDKSIENVRESLRGIQEKYQRTHTQMSKADQQLLNKLKREERHLNLKSTKIQSSIEEKESRSSQLSWRLISKILRFVTPFRIAMGTTCLCLSLIIVSSIVITNTDRLLNSECGFSCGFRVDSNSRYNPLDRFFLVLSKVFPLDLLFMGMLLFYVFVTCIFGIVKIGINFFWFKVRMDLLTEV